LDRSGVGLEVDAKDLKVIVVLASPGEGSKALELPVGGRPWLALGRLWCAPRGRQARWGNGRRRSRLRNGGRESGSSRWGQPRRTGAGDSRRRSEGRGAAGGGEGRGGRARRGGPGPRGRPGGCPPPRFHTGGRGRRT